MSTIKVIVSKDKFEARISIHSEKDSYPTQSQVKKILAEKGIVFGIDNDLLQQIIEDKKPVDSISIARGQLPVRGENAELVWSIEINYSSKPTITNTNKADFKHLKLFERIKKDQVLVSKLPPSEGVSGKNVFGENLIEKGSDVNFPLGKNTRISEDGLTMYSSIDGHAYWENDLLHIDNIYQIKGNVDYHTGNIRSNGIVIIDGDVRSGFRVEATESIIIGGNVDAASIYSQKGDVSVKCGVLGRGRAKILSGGDLNCGFVQDATLSAKGNINVEHYIINSTISAGGSISLIENEGLIRGGTISSGKKISAIEVGSDQKIYTELNIRIHSRDENKSHFWDVSKKKIELKKLLDGLKTRQSFIRLLQDRIDELSTGKKEELELITTKIRKCEETIKELELKDIQLKKENTSKAYTNEIKILKNLYSNIKINLGDIEYFTQDSIQSVRLFKLENEINIESLKEKIS